MASHDYVIANGTGSAVRADLNNALAAIVSNNSGSSEPATMYAYQWWADTTSGLLKQRNAANNAWITIGTLASANLGLVPLNGAGGTPTSLTLTNATGLPVAGGGTGAATFAANGVLFGNGTGAVGVTAVGTATHVLTSNGSGSAPTFQAASSTSDKISEGNTEAEVVDTGSDGHFKVTTEGTERLRITSDGSVGIGTSSPTTTVDVNASQAFLQLKSTGGTNSAGIQLVPGGQSQAFYIYNNGSRNLIFEDHATERMRIDSSGNVGIGTSSPNYKVDINGELGITEGQPVTWHDGSGNAAAQIFGDSSSNLIFRNGTSAMSERMRLDASGHFGIGATARLDQGGVFFRPGVTAGAAEISFNRADTASTSSPVTFYNNAGIVGSISYTNTATSFNTSSDYRLKENVVDLDGAITRVKQLAPKRFNFIVDVDRTVDGFLAHEAQAVVPEAVTGEKDGNDMQGIDQSKLVPLLTAALQEAIAKIEILEQRLSDAGIA